MCIKLNVFSLNHSIHIYTSSIKALRFKIQLRMITTKWQLFTFHFHPRMLLVPILLISSLPFYCCLFSAAPLPPLPSGSSFRSAPVNDKWQSCLAVCFPQSCIIHIPSHWEIVIQKKAKETHQNCEDWNALPCEWRKRRGKIVQLTIFITVSTIKNVL